MKRVFALMLVLAMCLTFAACGCKHEWYAPTCETPKTCSLCGETEGEPNGHSIVAVTCEEAEHCANCDYVNGEPLGHTWVDATTEAPKTCQTCGATEGERIITDPRFTTAATKDLQGTWEMFVPLTGDMMGIPGFPGTADINLQLVFGEAGELSIAAEVTDGFVDSVIQYTVDLMYAEFEAQGMDKETADALFADTYDATIYDYVAEEIGATDFNTMFATLFEAAGLSGVYYVEDGLLYNGNDWDSELVGDTFTLEGDSLVIDSFNSELGIEASFTRVTE